MLIDEASDKTCLVVETIGPAILAWPLRVIALEAGEAGLVYECGTRVLDTHFLEDPFRANANLPHQFAHREN